MNRVIELQHFDLAEHQLLKMYHHRVLALIKVFLSQVKVLLDNVGFLFDVLTILNLVTQSKNAGDLRAVFVVK
jgi:hypothetical protein